MRVIRSRKPNFVILDKYNLCQVSAIILDRNDSIKTSVKI